jgi:hypothetical protein
VDGAVPAEVRAALDRPFDVLDWPLFRVGVVAGGCPLLYVSMDHLVSDAVTLDVVRRDLAALYDAVVSGRPAELPPAGDYFTFATAQRRLFAPGPYRDARVASLHRVLAGRRPHPVFPLPDARWNLDVGRYVDIPLLGRADADRFARRCRSERATPFMGVLAAFGTALRAVFGVEEAGVLTAVTNREDPGSAAAVGWYANVLPVYHAVAGGFEGALRAVRLAWVATVNHHDLPMACVLPPPSAAPGPDRPVGCFVSFNDIRTGAGASVPLDPGRADAWKAVRVAPAYGAVYAMWVVLSDDGLHATVASPDPGPGRAGLHQFESRLARVLREAGNGS